MGTIKYAQIKEWPIEDIIELYRDASWWQESPAARDAITAMIAGSLIFIVAVDEGKAIGMGRVISDGVSDAYIQDVTVLQAYRRQGIGAAIIDILRRESLKRGIAWLGLIAEPGTTQFYEGLGFRTLDGFVPMRYLPVTS